MHQIILNSISYNSLMIKFSVFYPCLEDILFYSIKIFFMFFLIINIKKEMYCNDFYLVFFLNCILLTPFSPFFKKLMQFILRLFYEKLLNIYKFRNKNTQSSLITFLVENEI